MDQPNWDGRKYHWNSFKHCAAWLVILRCTKYQPYIRHQWRYHSITLLAHHIDECDRFLAYYASGKYISSKYSMEYVPPWIYGRKWNSFKHCSMSTKYLTNFVGLSCCDSFICVFIYHVTDEILIPLSFTGRDIYCRLMRSMFLIIMTSFASIYGLCLVTYERYIAIVHSLHYPRMMSVTRINILISVTWMISLLFSCPYLFTKIGKKDSVQVCDDNPSKLQQFETIIIVTFTCIWLLFGYLLPLIFMSWAYYKIQATLKRNAQQLNQQNVRAAAYELLQARQKLVNMLKIVIGALFILWTPTVIWILLSSLKEEQFYDHIMLFLINFLFYMNSVINPIIYVFKYKKFQKGLHEMLCSCIGRPKPNQINVQIALNEQNM